MSEKIEVNKEILIRMLHLFDEDNPYACCCCPLRKNGCDILEDGLYTYSECSEKILAFLLKEYSNG